MATLKLLSVYVVFFLLILFKKSHGLDRREAMESHHHTLEVSSLLPSTVCKPSTKGSSKRKASLEVLHRHGPCSPNNNPSLVEILSHDQSRVKSMQARLAFSTDMLTDSIRRDKKTTLPAQPGTSLGSGNYFVTIGIGTPKKDLSLIFDTGSDITWTQCEPCVKFCYSQKQEKLDPAKTSSYSNITCTSPQCSQLQSATGNSPGCSSSTCVYGIQYGDQSFSVGFFAKETLTLSTDVIYNIPFGCGQNNRGLFGSTAGLIGLGRHPLSIVSQTAAKYGKFFSYCLPSRAGSDGHLTFGKYGVPKNVQYTPFSNSPTNTFYQITITAISVGGQKLPISETVFKNAQTIIDSGTVVTRLPTPIYTALRDAFKQQMTSYKTAQPVSILDTCYDLSNYTSVKIPSVSFYFAGNVKVDIVANGILIAANGPSQVCLAFAEDDSMSIFGNLQQQTYEIVYDVAGGKLGFAAGACA